MPSPRWCDGATAEKAVAAAEDRFGAGVQVSVAPVRVGGVGGFFAREQFRATVVEPEPTEPSETHLDDEASGDGAAQVSARVAEALALLSAATDAAPATAPVDAPDEPEPAVPAATTPGAPQSAFLSALAQVQMTPTVTQAVARVTGTPPTAPPAAVAAGQVPAATAAPAVQLWPEQPRVTAAEPEQPRVPSPEPELPRVAATEAAAYGTGVATEAPVVVVREPAPPEHWARTVADLGVPADLVTPELLDRIHAQGAHAAFTHLFRQRIPAAPTPTTAPGQVIVVAGIGADALVGARYLAEAAGLDPDQTLMTPSASGVTCGPPELVVSAADQIPVLAATARESATATVVAVDVPLPRERGAVPAAVAAIADWAPTSVWAAVDTTRHGRDLAQWAATLPPLSGVVALHVEFAHAPASALACRAPVALLEARRATPARWASVLCERLAEDDEDDA